VWFSAALIILVLGGLVGSGIGALAAGSWFRYEEIRREAPYGPERAHVEALLSALNAIQTFKVLFLITDYDEDPRGESLRAGIVRLENFRNRSTLPEAKPVIDLNLGLAYLKAALIQEQNKDKDLGTKYMKSAQNLFQSLGWQDYSEETLRALARREHESWKPRPQTKESNK